MLELKCECVCESEFLNLDVIVNVNVKLMGMWNIGIRERVVMVNGKVIVNVFWRCRWVNLWIIVIREWICGVFCLRMVMCMLVSKMIVDGSVNWLNGWHCGSKLLGSEYCMVILLWCRGIRLIEGFLQWSFWKLCDWDGSVVKWIRTRTSGPVVLIPSRDCKASCHLELLGLSHIFMKTKIQSVIGQHALIKLMVHSSECLSITAFG